MGESSIYLRALYRFIYVHVSFETHTNYVKKSHENASVHFTCARLQMLQKEIMKLNISIESKENRIHSRALSFFCLF